MFSDNQEETFSIELFDGSTIRFKHILGRTQLAKLRKQAKTEAKTVTSKNCPPAWQPFFPEGDTETLFWVLFLGKVVAEEGAGPLDFLQLQHFKPVLFDSILQDVQARYIGGASLMEMADIDDEKKESRETAFGETDSRLPETFGASIPEN